MVVSIGKALSKASLEHPAKIEILPVSALWQPPETGQSIGNAPIASTKAPILRISASSVVLISSQIFPLLNPDKIPSEDSITSEQAFGDGKQVITTSHFFAIS